MFLFKAASHLLPTRTVVARRTRERLKQAGNLLTYPYRKILDFVNRKRGVQADVHGEHRVRRQSFSDKAPDFRRDDPNRRIELFIMEATVPLTQIYYVERQNYEMKLNKHQLIYL